MWSYNHDRSNMALGGFTPKQRLAIRLACAVFSISETWYRYESKQSAENEFIADWFLRLTDNHRTWGFGLCYFYLPNLRSFG